MTSGSDLETFSVLHDVTDGATNVDGNNVLLQSAIAEPRPPLAIASPDGSATLATLAVQEAKSSTLNVRVVNITAATDEVDILEAVIADKDKVTSGNNLVSILNAVSGEEDNTRVLVDKVDWLVDLDVGAG